ncbi:pH-sensitive chloride channel 2-like [Palaemon carinicauda]|uniref:pH-sensitive chloride channel 2-like n=1 Tax=Palaemon carinicauda TaxID=392227 RepID=UPI0035B65AA8
MSRKYNVTFNCALDLLMYPFDKQTCNIVLKMTSGTRRYITLKSDREGVTYSGGQHLVEYEVTGVDMKALEAAEDPASFQETSHESLLQHDLEVSHESLLQHYLSSPTKESNLEGDFRDVSTGSRYSRLLVALHFRRRYGFYLINTFLPTSLMIVIAYLTFYFKVEDFNDRIMVSLTSLLVLSSLFNQSSSSLPKTSYFKLVDVWFLTSIVTIFVIIVIQTILEHLRESEQERHLVPQRRSANFKSLIKSLVKSNIRQKISTERKNRHTTAGTSYSAWSSGNSLLQGPEQSSPLKNPWRTDHPVTSEELETDLSMSTRNPTQQEPSQKKLSPIQLLTEETHELGKRIAQGQDVKGSHHKHRFSWKFCSRVSKVGLLIIFVIFLITYWALALSSYQL